MDKTPKQQPTEISHLQIRAIQAPIAACLIKEFAKVVGIKKALEVATVAIQSDASTAGKQMAEKLGSNTLRDLARLVREVWSKDDAMTVDFLVESERNLHFNVMLCEYAELYRKLGMLELGYCLSCSRNDPFVKGFNSQIQLVRTQTIMQGAAYCDFRFMMV
jgi:hypothetical protein